VNTQPDSHSPYLEPQDDGLLMRPSGNWVVEKLFFLERYLKVFTVSMHEKPWRALNYIDLFAGPGKCRTREGGLVYVGSPLLALGAPYSFSNYFFVDSDARSTEALKKRIGISNLAQRVHVLLGDSNTVVRQIVDHIRQEDSKYRPGKWPSLNLAFLDPNGLELHWDTVASLSEVRTDLIIHYSQMGITRNVPVCAADNSDTIVDRFFGDRNWREFCESPRRSAELLSYYVAKLRQLGYEDVRRDDDLWQAPLIRSTKRRAPLYRLLFASRSSLGQKFWHTVTSKDAHGQKRLL
jgi:three-Cys-motif partner protein